MTTKSKAQQDKHKMSEIDDNISKLFDIKKRLGKGAYGIVWKALDRRTNETLAVKKIFDAFRDETDAQRTFREIIFLKAFRNHPNVIKLHTVYKAANNLDIYLIFEYMESDLHNIIKKGTILKDIHKRYVMYQLINAIKYIHSGNVIHRDLKPSNVLIDSKCRCKLADFGLARSVSSRPMRDTNDMSNDPIVEPLLTDYVATRWYRAPEILVASKRYTKGIDMWSLGCILGEMIRGKPLFQGSSTINQIEKIVTALPEITEHDICAVGAGFGSVLLSKQISRERKTSLDELLSDAPSDAVNMVKSLLVLDPLSRLTAKQALEHSYVEKFRNSIPEIELNVDILPPFRDDVRLSVPEYRSKLYEIVQLNTDKQDKRHVSSWAKNAAKHRDHKHQMPFDKGESTTKKSHKVKQHTDEKYISKEKYLSRPEKHEMETQPSVSVPSIASKALKKTIVSPVAKRKAKQSHIKSSFHSNDQRASAPQQVDEKALYALSKTKNHSRGNESLEEHAHTHLYDKRHSIDCGYGSLPDGGSKQPPTSPNGLKKLDSGRRLHRSSSALHRGEQVNQQALAQNTHYHHSRERATHTAVPSHQQPATVYSYNDKHTELSSAPMEQHERLNRSTPTVSNLSQKSSYVRNTKSDLMPGNAPTSTATNKPNERICYEKRLKKLEEEIEKYKKEVKSFCKDTFSYTYQQSPRTRTHNSHSHSQNHSQSQSQSQTRSHTPTRNNQQQQQGQGQQQQQQAKGQQQYLQQHNHAAKYSGNTKTTQPNQTPSLPIVAAQPGGSTPKSNPYFRIVAKATRDFAKGEFVKGEYELAYADTGGDAADNGYNVLNSLGQEADNDRKHELHHHQHQHSHSHHQQHLHHQQHKQHHQQRSRPVSKFISRPQVSEQNAKASISNYQ